ncbi:MAG: protein translocase subunit SecD [Verrucomicrobiota bacterium]
MDYTILGLSFLFLIFFVWYLASSYDRSRRWVALGLIASLITISTLSLVRFDDGDTSGSLPWPVNITPGIDLRGGTQFIVEIQTATESEEAGDTKKKEISPAALEQAQKVFEDRLNKLGTSDVLVQPLGENRIIIQVPGVSQNDKVKYRSTLERVAKLEFKLVHPQNEVLLSQIKAGQEEIPFDHEILPLWDRDKEGNRIKREILVTRKTEMGGKHVTTAFPTLGQLGMPEVIINFDSKGSDLFGKLTASNIGRRLAIVLDREVYTAPNIQSAIYGSCQISGGDMTRAEAEEIASVLENPLETPVKIVDERGVDPTLGKASVKDGFNAAVIGFCLVIVFMAIYYRIAGAFAVVALVFNLVILLGLFAQFGFTLTLPGVAGVILTIGMAVDANVLIFERIREEMDEGKPLKNSIQAGFSKAFSSIFDANVTTFIAALFMFWQGSGAVRGFAIVLCLGILSSLFTALVSTRACFDWMMTLYKSSKLNMTHVLTKTKIDFMSMRRIAVIVSVVLIGGSIANWVNKGSDSLGVDFAGGALASYSFEKKISDDELQAAAGSLPVTFQYQDSYGEGGEILSVKASKEVIEDVHSKITEAFPDAKFDRLQLDKVAASIGKEFFKSSAVALALGLIGIFLYIVWRFETSFAIGAIVALIHDVTITLGIFTALGYQFSLTTVGAILTVAGYSINDTIVVFDRIREGLRLDPRQELKDVVNNCLNATLSRTMITSLTTGLSVLALFFFGGFVIHDFSLLLLTGVLVGTYSSIFVASPIILLFGAKAKQEAAIDPEYIATSS